MPTCLRFLFSYLLVLFLLLLTTSLSSPQPLCHQDESLALMQFRDSFDITGCSYPKAASWSVEAEGDRSNCCSWDGVECDPHTGHVIGLDLSHECLSGSINSNSSLFRLSYLQSLNLAYNDFKSSKIPSTIGNLSRLTNLQLSYSNVLGEVPESLANLSSLRNLEIEGCRLYGEFPIQIFHLPQLQVLRMGNNEDLTGRLPEFHSSTILRALSISHTSFSAKLPNSIGNLNSLKVLDIANCNFSRSIPNSLWNLTQLTHLDLSRNSFDDLSCLTKASSSHSLPCLQYLFLSSLNLTKFPNFLRNQNKLKRLDLSKNNIQGILPKWMFNASKENLQDLILSHNFLTGFENSPDVLPWPNLQKFNLQNNMLHGSLPIPPPSISIYQVRNNSFTGEVSPLFCNLSSIYVLDLSLNYLRGMMHPCFCNLSQNFAVLELRSNNIGGTIPDAWAKGCSLSIIDLSLNQLQGRLPRSLANCKELRYLNVGNNQIHDTFPLWLKTLPELKIFILRSNGFYGAISNIQTNCTFSKLQIIDLSHNNFSGDLPAECFQRWNAMKLFGAKNVQYLDYTSPIHYSVTLTFRGLELEFERIYDILMVIDLSCNRFEGGIPEVVGSLKGLIVLNFSKNALSGRIPSSLANLRALESLDLSQNKLSGVIPPQLIQLELLTSFQVSNNSLTGPIPQGRQFDTYEQSSFDGNVGLCGRPLSKACGDSQPKPPTLMFVTGDQELSILFCKRL